MNTVKLENNWQRKKILQSKEHQLIAYEEINEQIVTKRQGKKITLLDGTELIEFLSCSYLGLDQNEHVISSSINRLHEGGVNFAVSRTRLRMSDFVTLESLLNQIFLDGYSTTFSSLHVAHLGMIPLLTSGELPSFPIKKNGILNIIDTSAHASLQINRGLMQQFGETILLNVNDPSLLEPILKKAQENELTPLIFADGICSMGGMTTIKSIFDLLDQYEGYAYLDDAHGTSVFGTHGCGYALESLSSFHPRLILAASLSKGFGTNGGVVIVPTLEDELMIKRFCSTYIFGNPMPLAAVSASIVSAKIHLSDELGLLQKKLHSNRLLFDNAIHATEHVVNYNTPSPIRGLHIGNEHKAIQLTLQLKKAGFAVSAAMYPTVAKGKSILRITISANHTEQDIAQLCEKLNEFNLAY